MSFQEIQVQFDTGLDRVLVGTLAATERQVLFEYDSAWISGGFELAPLHLPLAQKEFRFDMNRLPDRVPGLFADSLPDGWGTLIMDRYFIRRGVDRQRITPIDRLAWLGCEAMGALCYQPSLRSEQAQYEAFQIGAAAHEALQLFEGKLADAGRLLSRIGGSPGGARPKALIGIAADGDHFVSGTGALPEGYTHWLVKFSSAHKYTAGSFGNYEGVLEQICLKTAAAAGITTPESRLIDDGSGLLHFAVRRFDRPTIASRRHVATASGLLHADHRLPSLDYTDLLKLAWILTQDASQVLEQYRRAVFNLFVGNLDDHAKNHGYLMDESGRWHLAPVYDLTFSGEPEGEHWTSYLGKGSRPDKATLLKLAEVASIRKSDAVAVIEQVQSAVALFGDLARESCLPQSLRRQLEKRFTSVISSDIP